MQNQPFLLRFCSICLKLSPISNALRLFFLIRWPSGSEIGGGLAEAGSGDAGARGGGRLLGFTFFSALTRSGGNRSDRVVLEELDSDGGASIFVNVLRMHAVHDASSSARVPAPAG
jgi:hypothetical protein